MIEKIKNILFRLTQVFQVINILLTVSILVKICITNTSDTIIITKWSLCAWVLYVIISMAIMETIFIYTKRLSFIAEIRDNYDINKYDFISVNMLNMIICILTGLLISSFSEIFFHIMPLFIKTSAIIIIIICAFKALWMFKMWLYKLFCR